MAKELKYRLTNPNYTIYHRAALGGLAATVHAWEKKHPVGIQAKVTCDQVRISWDDSITDQEALRRILAASFKLSEDKMIDLPGQGVRTGQADLRLAIHNGLTRTFLQHPKTRPGEKEPRRISLKSADDDFGEIFTYKAVDSYAHQEAQGTGLLKGMHNGRLPNTASIPQSVVPRAFSGARALEAPADEVILLLYLMVGCSIFLLRSRTYQEKAQFCVVVPDVINLVAFARALKRIAVSGQGIKRFSNSYLGRIVGGAEEAALRFLIDIQAEEIASEHSVGGCQAVAMGKVAWDSNQINRSISVRLKGDYDEMNVFRAANTYLGGSKVLKSKKGDGYAIPSSPVPELVAANLAGERHWCAHFRTLVGDKKEFARMRYAQGGLKAMKEAITSADDQAIIRAFQEAWRLTMRALGERARRDGLSFERLVEVERERIRNAILRTKTADALAGWFLRFCADATKGGSLGHLRSGAMQIREFIFNPRNFDRFQNLCLFALVSYSNEEPKTTTRERG